MLGQRNHVGDTVGTGRQIVPMHTGDSRDRAVAVLVSAYATVAERGGSVPLVERAFETEGGNDVLLVDIYCERLGVGAVLFSCRQQQTTNNRQ